MSFELLIALAAAAINIILALLLIIRGVKSIFSANFFFILLIFSIAAWSVALGVSETTDSAKVSEIFGRATFGLSGMVLYFSYISVLLLSPRSAKYRRSAIWVTTIASIFLIPLFFTGFVYSVPDVATFLYGSGIKLYMLYLLIFVGLIVNEAIFTNRNGNKEQRHQVRLVAGGLGIMISAVALTNVIIPTISGNENLTTLSPIASVIYSLLIVYAIAKHKLFDIRLIAARSLAYIMSLTFLGLLFGFLAFVVIDGILFDGVTLEVTTRRIIYISLALLSGLAFAPAKRVFDKISNRIFYRDAYDAQAFIDSFTGTLVGNTDMSKIIHESTELIKLNLKPVFVEFMLIDERNKDTLGGKIVQSLNEHAVKDLMTQIGSSSERVIAVDDLSNTKQRSIVSLFRSKNIALTVRLVNRSGLLGAVLIGPKKSGNMYNRQDIEIFEIIADELSLALENSLSYEEIQKFNVTLQQEVEDATKQLRKTNEKLKALDETKDEFISMASHQLRTPLTSVKGYVSMVLEGDAGELNDQQRKLLNQAFISSQRMVYLIADLLNVSRLRTGKFIIEATPTFLPEVVEGELSQLYETAEAKGLKLHFAKPEQFPTLNLDETKIRQVIMNFADNAIYYTPNGGEITVALDSTPATIEFTVTDTGLGVPKKEQHHLFSKFYRAENAKKARPDGTGLGLFMAKKVVIAQGGAIIFKSQEGKGSTFGFTFPRKGLETESIGKETEESSS